MSFQNARIVAVPTRRTLGWARKSATIGARFGRLVVLSEIGKTKDYRRQILCKCDCGKEHTAVEKSVVSGRTKSCGCLHLETVATKPIKHGEKTGGMVSAEYRIWVGMKDRTSNPNCVSYKTYGGRGIVVCDRWKGSFESFLADMGRRPSQKHSLDRINVDGNYEPSNCRWATRVEQQNNTTRNRFLEFNSRRMTVAEWSREVGIPHAAIYMRLQRGWSVERTLTQPVQY